ncbi:MAG: hypothetical protein J7513_11255 [Solirubrobacteraceae bacterium]|nr:hypothetical protein [Solirubrobacteraceae bacterium]
MANDPRNDDTTKAAGGSDDPTVVIDPGAASQDEPLWSGGASDAPDDDVSRAEDAAAGDDRAAQLKAKADEVRAASGEKAGALRESATVKAADLLEKADEVRAAAGDKAAGLKGKAGEKTSDTREKAGAKAAAFAAFARERAANADMKEWAASTTSLIDTARPFFLAAFAIVFTTLGFVAGDSGTAQWFVVGAILFVLAAAFSDELGHIVPRKRPDHED